MQGQLSIDGRQEPLSAEYSLRFYWNADRQCLEATLYRQGKRVTRAWLLHLIIEQPADAYGGNANTE